MARTIENRPLQRHTLWLYQGDFDKLGAYFPKVGASVALRRIVGSFLENIDAQIPEPKIDLKDIDI